MTLARSSCYDGRCSDRLWVLKKLVEQNTVVRYAVTVLLTLGLTGCLTASDPEGARIRSFANMQPPIDGYMSIRTIGRCGRVVTPPSV